MCEQYMDHWTSNSILYKVIASASLSVGVCETLDQWTSQTIVEPRVSVPWRCVCKKWTRGPEYFKQKKSAMYS